MSDTAHTFGVKTVDRSLNGANQVYHEAKDAALEGVHWAKEAAVEGHDALKRFIEERPHTASVAFLVLGMLVGVCMARRDTSWY